MPVTHGVAGSSPVQTAKEISEGDKRKFVPFFNFGSCHILYTYCIHLGGIHFYKGQTFNMEKRIKYHSGGYEVTTSKGVPWEIIWTTQKPSRSAALEFEAKLKNLSRARLIALMLKYSDGIYSESALAKLNSLESAAGSS